MRYITRTVWILSVVSFFTDVASEMLYPVMPVYLKSIGFSIMLIGVLEGLAEATTGLSKGYFGNWSDHSGRRAPFVQLGYALSALAKPLMPLFITPVWVFFARTLERLGKGIRTGARDAMLSDEATPATKGKVFGFHRSMDTLGAVAGPLLALLYLYYFPHQYTTLFYIAFAPGLAALAASSLIRDKTVTEQAQPKPVSFFAFLRYWRTSPVRYRKVATGLLVFTLFNSSDVFLLLRLKETGISDTDMILYYVFYNLVYAVFAFPMGVIADRISLKTVLLCGLLLFTAAYAGMGFNPDPAMCWVIFFLYGLYSAATEGITKAWISNITDRKDTATAIGTFSGFQSICMMIASALAGFIWFRFGAAATFFTTAAVALGVTVYFLLAVPAPGPVPAEGK